SLPPLPPSPAPPCLPCVEGRQRGGPHSSFPSTTAPLQTLHMDVWGPARVSGQGRERYFMLVVDDYTRNTMVFPLRSKGEVPDVLIPWIRAVCLQLRERFHQDLPVLHLHSDRGVMEVARTSMIRAAAPHFMWPFAVEYAAHQLNLWPHVSLPETLSTLRWTGEVGDASVFRVWGSSAFVRDTSADKLSACAIPCVFLGFSAETLPLETLELEVLELLVLEVLELLLELVVLEVLQLLVPEVLLPGVLELPGLVVLGAVELEELGLETLQSQEVLGLEALELEALALVALELEELELETLELLALELEALALVALELETLELLTLEPEVLELRVLCLVVLSVVSAVCTGRRVPRPRPPPVPGTHTMALRPSSVPLRVPLPPPPKSSLPAAPNPESNLARAASLTISRLLASVVTDPSFESTAAPALVAELVHFAAACRLDYATALVAESESANPPSVEGECTLGTDVLEDRQEDIECLAAAVPHLVTKLLAPEGDSDAPDIQTPRSYTEVITGPYSSQW
ncbi:unnamed protein product, partial [Closterium sp. NIES-54]